MDVISGEPLSGADVVAELKAADDLDPFFARIAVTQIRLVFNNMTTDHQARQEHQLPAAA